jgi:hypothetical protein
MTPTKLATDRLGSYGPRCWTVAAARKTYAIRLAAEGGGQSWFRSARAATRA